MDALKFNSTLLAHKCGILLNLLLLFWSALVLAEAPESLHNILPHARLNKTINEADRITFSGDRLPLLDESEDKGPVDGNLPLKNMLLTLKSSAAQLAALDKFSLAQQTPGAVEYHHWLTPQEFAAHFGVASEDLATLKNYLINQGFSIDEISPGGRSIKFSGTVAQVNQAFHTEMHHYTWHGENHIANNSNPQIPAALAPVVQGIVNLHNFHSRPQPPPAQFSNVWPVNSALANSSVLGNTLLSIPNYNIGTSNYLTPGDYGVIYNINPLYAAGVNGSGLKIAVLGRSDIVAADVSKFQSFAGLATNPPQTIITNTDPGLVSGDQFESSLDVEWAAGVAPGATVQFITSASTANADGVVLSANYAVSANVADIISLSYELCEANLQYSGWYYMDSLWYQASVQGQTVLVASGDSGAAGCDATSNPKAIYGLGVNGLCSSPYSTCVGGTQFLDTTKQASYWLAANPTGGATTTALSYIPEEVWNQSGSNLEASGGGASIFAVKPSWQVSPGVPVNTQRDVPDIALAAATHDPYIIYMNGSQSLVGGTSAATPSLAGIMALVAQYNGGRLGNINPALYGLYQLQAKGSLGFNYFHPTVSGNNSVPGQTGFTATGTGYNQATGLGSVNANLLVTQWQNLTPGTSSVTLSSSTATITAGQAVTFTATVSGFHPSGTVQFQANGIKLASAVTLSNSVATLTTTGLTTVGSNSVTAVYSGDGNNLTSTSAAQTETVLAASTITLSVSADTVSVGQNLTITATISGASPTGSIQFYSNGVALGNPVPLVNGVAELNITSLTSSGLDSLTATYSGDSNNAAVTSVAITETVIQPKSVPALAVWQEMLLALVLLMIMFGIQRKHLSA
jgi:subtilase family serine protease